MGRVYQTIRLWRASGNSQERATPGEAGSHEGGPDLALRVSFEPRVPCASATTPDEFILPIGHHPVVLFHNLDADEIEPESGAGGPYPEPDPFAEQWVPAYSLNGAGWVGLRGISPHEKVRGRP